MKTLLEFKIDDDVSAFIQIEENNPEEGRQRAVFRNEDNKTHDFHTAQQKFSDAIRCIAPVGNSLLSVLKDINTPDEINLEFGFTFNAATGVVFTSIESEINFKVNITWKNNK